MVTLSHYPDNNGRTSSATEDFSSFCANQHFSGLHFDWQCPRNRLFFLISFYGLAYLLTVYFFHTIFSSVISYSVCHALLPVLVRHSPSTGFDRIPLSLLLTVRQPHASVLSVQSTCTWAADADCVCVSCVLCSHGNPWCQKFWTCLVFPFARGLKQMRKIWNIWIIYWKQDKIRKTKSGN